MDRYVWVGGEGPAWMRGGSYLVSRRIRMLLEIWDRSSLEDQEQTIGRDKYSGAPLGGDDEFDPLALDAKQASGQPAIPVDAHVRLASAQDNDGERILRRGYSFTDGVDESLGELEAGLFFIAFQRDPERQFVAIQRRLGSDGRAERVHQARRQRRLRRPPGRPQGRLRRRNPARLSPIPTPSLGFSLGCPNSFRTVTRSSQPDDPIPPPRRADRHAVGLLAVFAAACGSSEDAPAGAKKMSLQADRRRLPAARRQGTRRPDHLRSRKRRQLEGDRDGGAGRGNDPGREGEPLRRALRQLLADPGGRRIHPPLQRRRRRRRDADRQRQAQVRRQPRGRSGGPAVPRVHREEHRRAGRRNEAVRRRGRRRRRRQGETALPGGTRPV